MENARTINPFALRLPPETRARLKRAADISGRSLNSEILARIESSFGEDQTEKRLADIEAALRQAGLVKVKKKA